MNKYILAIDAGTIETGFCYIERETYKPVFFGKVENDTLLKYMKGIAIDDANGEFYVIDEYDLVYEQFKSYGMPMGDSTIESIQWNGRFIQAYVDKNMKEKKLTPIMRVQEKVNLCGSVKAKDSNIRQALIDRFGVVGTKKSPGWFYGFKKDIWSAYAIGVTALDMEKKHGKFN